MGENLLKDLLKTVLPEKSKSPQTSANQEEEPWGPLDQTTNYKKEDNSEVIRAAVQERENFLTRMRKKADLLEKEILKFQKAKQNFDQKSEMLEEAKNKYMNKLKKLESEQEQWRTQQKKQFTLKQEALAKSLKSSESRLSHNEREKHLTLVEEHKKLQADAKTREKRDSVIIAKLRKEIQQLKGQNQLLTEKSSKLHTLESNQFSISDYFQSKPSLLQEDFGERASKTLSDGRTLSRLPNGTVKEKAPNGYLAIHYPNGDVKQKFPDGTVNYYFAEVGTLQTVKDQETVTRFANGQTEKTKGDGSKKVKYCDGSVRVTFADGSEECHYPDGVIEYSKPDGEKVIQYPYGFLETYSEEFKWHN